MRTVLLYNRYKDSIPFEFNGQKLASIVCVDEALICGQRGLCDFGIGQSRSIFNCLDYKEKMDISF